jgi:AsmA family protein
VERQASHALGHSVHLADLDVEVSSQPVFRLRGITVDNPEDFASDAPPLGSIEHLQVQLALRELFSHRLRILQLEITQPAANLLRDARGQANWPMPQAGSAPSDAKPWHIQIESLRILDGQFVLRDPLRKADLQGSLRTQDGDGVQEAKLLVTADGHYDSQPFTARLTGGSALTLRSAENPYPVDFFARSGDTQITLKGSLQDPMRFAGAELRLLLQGKNLGALGSLLQLPLPNSPPYRLEGDLDYRRDTVVLHQLKGHLGESDIAGDLSFQRRHPRPLLTATIHSKQVRLEDLSGLIGGNPNEPDANAPNGDGRVLPSRPINVPLLQQADANLDFTGQKIIGDRLPFDRLAFKLTLDNGIMRASPVDFGIGEGAMRIYATLDPRGEQLGIQAQAELRGVDVSQLMARTGYQGHGRIGGHASLRSRGHSTAELLGNGSGELKLAMAGGDFSALLLDLSGLDFGNALLTAIGTGGRTNVRCLVGDFALTLGQFTTRSFVLDTGTTNLLLDGGINFRDETLAMRLQTKPKRANIGRLRAPIHIGGTLANPSIRPDWLELGARSVSAVALGTLLTPLAALLPTLQLGPGEDRDCQNLLAEAGTSAPPQPRS